MVTAVGRRRGDETVPPSPPPRGAATCFRLGFKGSAVSVEEQDAVIFIVEF